MNIQPSTPTTPLRARMIADMSGRNLGPASQTSHLRACKRLAAWLGRSPETATPDDVKYFQQHLIESGASIGTRAGEVVRLKVGDIDSDQEIIRIVQSKGRKDRNVMLPVDILSLLRGWWKERPTGQDKDVPASERVLFPGYRGKHLSPRQISRLFKEAAREAGITKPVTLHTLRHSFATHLLERGVDIRVIQALLGHAKLTTTARYASVATGMIAAVDSPLDDLNGAKRKKGKPKPS